MPAYKLPQVLYFCQSMGGHAAQLYAGKNKGALPTSRCISNGLLTSANVCCRTNFCLHQRQRFCNKTVVLQAVSEERCLEPL